MRLGLLRPRSRFFRLDSSSASSSSNGADAGLKNPMLVREKKTSKDGNGDVLQELCSLVFSVAGKPDAVVASASTRSRLLQQRHNLTECVAREVGSSGARGFFSHAEVILDILGPLDDCEDVGRVLALEGRFDTVLTDPLVARVVLGAQSVASASSFFNWASRCGHYRPGILAYDCLVQVLVKSGRVRDAYHKFQELTRISLVPSKFTYGTLIDALAGHGDEEKAVMVFEEFKELYQGEGEEDVVQCFTFLVSGLCKAGKLTEATKYFHRYRKSLRFVSVVVYNSLIDGLVKAKLVNKALQVFRDMDEDLCQPNAHTYGALISGLCRCSRAHDACELFDQMIEKGFTPHAVISTTLIDGLCKAKQFDKACSYLEKVEEPDIVTYSTLIDGLCNVGEVDYAFELLEQIKERGKTQPDVVLYTIFIKGLFKTGQVENALDLFNKMEENGCSPNTVTYNTVIRALTWHKSVDDARRLFTEMIRKGCEPDASTYVLVSEVFLKSKSLEDARKLTEEIRAECGGVQGLNEYGSQIGDLCRQGKVDDAYRIFQTIPKDVQPTVGIYASLVQGFLREERALEADKLVKDMLGRGCAPSWEIHNAVMAGLRWMLRKKKLPDFVHKTVSRIDKEEWVPATVLCDSLVEGLCEAGYPGLARRLVAKLDKKGSINHHLWDTLARMLYASGNIRVSVEIAEEAVRKGRQFHPPTYYQIIRGLVRVGKLNKAVEQFRKFVENGRPVCTRQLAMLHSYLVGKLCVRGRITRSYDLHQEMVKRGLSPTTKSYKLLIKHHFKIGKGEIPRQLSDQMEKVGTPRTRDTYRLLVEGYCQLGLLDEACTAFEEMVCREFSLPGHIHFELVRKLCDRGRTDEAHRVLLLLGNRPLLTSYNAVFQAYYQAENFVKAREVFQQLLKLFRIDKGKEFPITEEQLRTIFEQPR